jgi:hypothetical protein
MYIQPMPMVIASGFLNTLGDQDGKQPMIL